MKKIFILSEQHDLNKFEPFSDISKKIYYHGRTVTSEEFSLDYVDSPTANKEYGGGFYFTNSLLGALGYAHPNGIILKCQINYNKTRLLNTRKKPTEFFVTRLIKKSPDEYALSNFGENPTRALYDAVAAYMEYDNAFDAYTTLENDFYHNNSKEFLKIFGKVFDGYMIPKFENSNFQNFVCYRPELIKIIDKIEYKTLKQWEE